MIEYLVGISKTLGISTGLLIVILFWEVTWKLIAMWKSARKGSIIWFIILAVFNTMGILPILYYFIFSEMKFSRSTPVKKVKKKTVKRKKR